MVTSSLHGHQLYNVLIATVLVIACSPHTALPLAQPVEVVLFFTRPVLAIFGIPYYKLLI